MNNTNQIHEIDTLQDTFDLFFNETEETAGTGTVVRTIGGVLTSVVVDEAERAAFLTEKRAEADAHNAKIDAIHELVERLNS